MPGVLGLGILLQAGWIPVKAHLAQWMIAAAWESGRALPPWPWADTRPVGRLRWREGGIDQLVLDGGSGESLAFGPARLAGSAPPGRTGIVAIAGHRDTHFRFLAELEAGAELELETADGTVRQYAVKSSRVIDSQREPLWIGGDALVLVTCYPFAAFSGGGPLRYVVTARPMSQK